MSKGIQLGRYRGGRVVLAIVGVCFVAQPVFSQQREPCGVSTRYRQPVDARGETAKSEYASSRLSIRIDVRAEPFRGSPEAPVAIIEYGDYQCSHCGRFKRDIYPQLEANYVRASKLKYIYRDLPLASHRYALPAARAAYCAREQEKYWEMHDAIFALGQSFSADDLTERAEAIGMRMPEFASCTAADHSKDEILRLAADARMMQITNTPTFLIGRQEQDRRWVEVKSIVVGVKTLADYAAIIDGLVAESASDDGCRDTPQS